MSISIILDVVEVLGVEDGFLQPALVLGVAEPGLDAGVVNVVQGVLAQEGVADDAQALGLLLLLPQVPQVRDCVYALFQVPQFGQQRFVAVPVSLQHFLQYVPVLLNEYNDGLPVVFGDVFGLVFHGFLLLLAALLPLRLGSLSIGLGALNLGLLGHWGWLLFLRCRVLRLILVVRSALDIMPQLGSPVGSEGADAVLDGGEIAQPSHAEGVELNLLLPELGAGHPLSR